MILRYPLRKEKQKQLSIVALKIAFLKNLRKFAGKQLQGILIFSTGPGLELY